MGITYSQYRCRIRTHWLVPNHPGCSGPPGRGVWRAFPRPTTLRTADDRQESGGTEDFALPECSDVAYGPQRLNTAIRAYEAFLNRGPQHRRPQLPPRARTAAARNPTSAQTSTRAEPDDLGGFRFTAGQRPTRADSAGLLSCSGLVPVAVGEGSAWWLTVFNCLVSGNLRAAGVAVVVLVAGWIVIGAAGEQGSSEGFRSFCGGLAPGKCCVVVAGGGRHRASA